jgi:hypothetical protein
LAIIFVLSRNLNDYDLPEQATLEEIHWAAWDNNLRLGAYYSSDYIDLRTPHPNNCGHLRATYHPLNPTNYPRRAVNRYLETNPYHPPKTPA